jgi:hypothetical protein
MTQEKCGWVSRLRFSCVTVCKVNRPYVMPTTKDRCYAIAQTDRDIHNHPYTKPVTVNHTPCIINLGGPVVGNNARKKPTGAVWLALLGGIGRTESAHTSCSYPVLLPVPTVGTYLLRSVRVAADVQN